MALIRSSRFQCPGKLIRARCVPLAGDPLQTPYRFHDWHSLHQCRYCLGITGATVDECGADNAPGFNLNIDPRGARTSCFITETHSGISLFVWLGNDLPFNCAGKSERGCIVRQPSRNLKCFRRKSSYTPSVTWRIDGQLPQMSRQTG